MAKRVYLIEMAERKTKNSKKKVFVGMSGGVDSSVAAYLLKKQGYDVAGVFIRGYNVDGCQDKDAEDARRVAEKLKIPFYAIDLEKEYKEKVVDYMVSGYHKGLTPNPDVVCNKEIKFGLFLEKALEMGADFVATGHYVKLASHHISRGTSHLFSPAEKSGFDSRRVRPAVGGNQAARASETFRSKRGEKLAQYSLLEAYDKNKDQSYFLWTLTQEQLKHCLFPIGGYLKSEAREIARKAGLPTAEKKDSQGICFLGQVSMRDFLKRELPVKRGEVVTMEGEKIGEHEGAHFYTIGQRHIGISNFKSPTFATATAGKQTSNRKPFYIADKNIKENKLIAAEGSENQALYKSEIQLENTSWISKKAPDFLFFNSRELKNKKGSILVRVRYRQPLVPATLKIENSRLRRGLGGQAKLKIEFNKPVKFVAPGQSAVFYSASGEMLGGGVIK